MLLSCQAEPGVRRRGRPAGCSRQLQRSAFKVPPAASCQAEPIKAWN
jgi:hypothetical protein